MRLITLIPPRHTQSHKHNVRIYYAISGPNRKIQTMYSAKKKAVKRNRALPIHNPYAALPQPRGWWYQ